MKIIQEVSITDIIQSFGVLLVVPSTIWGIFQLFRRDKDKEAQLKSLNDIVISQNAVIGKMTEQIKELARQT